MKSKTNWQRVLSLVLCAVMCLSLLPMAALAESGTISGSTTNSDDVIGTVDLSSDNFITFRSSGAFSIKANTKGWNGSVEYSTDNKTWTEWDGSQVSAAKLGGNYYLHFRGNGNTVITGGYDGRWILNAKALVSCYGNIMSLLRYPLDPSSATMGSNCFNSLFRGWTKLAKAPELPATTLSESCYDAMFYNCESLTVAPALPAETMKDSCYNSMFYGCKSLTAAPALPAETLSDHCYSEMFSGCTALTAAQQLPATELQNSCYRKMFEGCTGIKLCKTGSGDAWSIPAEATAEGADNWNEDMFKSTGGDIDTAPVIGTTYYYLSSSDDPITYTVTFNVNGHGTAPDAQTVESGEKAAKPAEPTESGWMFAGWYTDEDCTAAFDFEQALYEDTTIYAKWLTLPEATALSFTRNGAKIVLSWNAVSGATEYRVYRSTDGVNYSLYTTTAKTTYTNSAVTSGTRYYYKVTAVATVNGTDYESGFSNVKSTVPVATPTLSFTRSGAKIKLSWSAVTGATKYWVYRSTDGVNYKLYATTTSTAYTNSVVTSGTKYYYKVKAVVTVGETNYASNYSNVKSTVPVATPKLSASRGSVSVKLSWDTVTGATKYWIYRSTDGVNYKLYDTTTKTTYYNSRITAGTEYYYKVKAVVTVGGTNYASSYSNTAYIVP